MARDANPARPRRGRDRTEQELQALRAVAGRLLDADALTAIRQGLASKSHLVVARAATVAADAGARALLADLASAFTRLLDEPVRSDPGCTAKLALLRALSTLETDDPAIFLAAARHVQREPAWGAPVDTAAALRGSALFALVAMGHRDAQFVAAPLLVDREVETRRLAAEALGHLPIDGAELLLRLKVLAGDREPSVLVECLAALMRANPERSLSFVAGQLDADDPDVALGAALALGESRLDEALEALTRAFAATPAEGARLGLLLPIALVRSERALAFLVGVLEQAPRRQAQAAAAALRLFRGDERAAPRIAEALERRADPELTAAFASEGDETPE